jgi:acyl-CoA thioester hydrolase
MPRFSESRFRVRYAETDQMGVVYYANYLVWMEIGRTDLCRESGFVYHDLEKEAGISIAVAQAECRYHAPARYDDEILVRTSLERVRWRTMTFSYEIENAATGQRLAEGRTTHVAVGKDGKPKSLPDRYGRLLAAFGGE